MYISALVLSDVIKTSNLNKHRVALVCSYELK